MQSVSPAVYVGYSGIIRFLLFKNQDSSCFIDKNPEKSHFLGC